MSFTGLIYDKAPLPLQNLAISLYGWFWRRRRYGGIYENEYRQFRERESFTVQQWDSHVSAALNKILLHAWDNVPYYRQTWQTAGLSRERLSTITPADMHLLPFLEKDDLRRFCKTTLLAGTLEKQGQYFASSGTTGTPTSILFSATMHQRWTAAFESRIRIWAGLNRFDSRGMIGGRRIISKAIASPPYYRYNMPEKQVYFSAYHISESTAADYLEGIRKYKPAYMTGYTVSNYILAHYFEKLRLDAPQLKAVITSSEKLTQEMRDTFRRVYDCKTYDSYSGVEACSLISECEHGGLHISPDVGLIEFLNADGKPAKPGEYAEMVCTGFLNYDQPLIRYRIGDWAILDDRKCACGREMPLVKDISGRTEDIITGKDGRKMVRFHGLFIDMPNIVQAQVVQKSFEDYVIRVVSMPPLSEGNKATISARMKSQLGGQIRISFEQVDAILPEANGKYKAVISEISSQIPL